MTCVSTDHLRSLHSKPIAYSLRRHQKPLYAFNGNQLVYFVSMVPQLHPPVFVGADLLVRLGIQLATVNQVL